MSVRLNFEYNLRVFLRMPERNTRIKADFRPVRAARLVVRRMQCSVMHVVAALPQGAETFRLIRYPSPLGGSVHGLHRPPIFTFHTEKMTQAFGHACQC